MKNQEWDKTGRAMPLLRKFGMVVVGLLLIMGGIELYRSYHYQQQLLLTAQYELEAAQKEAREAKQEAEAAKLEAKEAKQEAEAARQEAENEREQRKAALETAGNAQNAAGTTQTAPAEKGAPVAAAYLEGSTIVNYTARVVSSDGIGVNLRQGPGSSYPKVQDKPIPVGEMLTITAEKTVQHSAVWGYTQYDGLNGWVYLAELELT